MRKIFFSKNWDVTNKSTGRIEESCSVVFKENDSSQGGRYVTCDVDDEIPQDAIRRMGMGFIRPIEGTLWRTENNYALLK
jgi:hypothetical protein